MACVLWASASCSQMSPPSKKNGVVFPTVSGFFSLLFSISLNSLIFGCLVSYLLPWCLLLPSLESYFWGEVSHPRSHTGLHEIILFKRFVNRNSNDVSPLWGRFISLKSLLPFCSFGEVVGMGWFPLPSVLKVSLRPPQGGRSPSSNAWSCSRLQGEMTFSLVSFRGGFISCFLLPSERQNLKAWDLVY